MRTGNLEGSSASWVFRVMPTLSSESRGGPLASFQLVGPVSSPQARCQVGIRKHRDWSCPHWSPLSPEACWFHAVPLVPGQVVKKVKSMQMFHTPVTTAMQGDRLGICVTQFDPKLLERGLVCAPESLHTVHAAIISVEKISYFRGPLQTKAKFHITVGHETVMGRLLFFSPAPDSFDREPVLDSFDFSQEYLFQEQYLCKDSASAVVDSNETNKRTSQAAEGYCPRQQWALVEFEKPITCPRLSLVIGSRLDADIHANACRLAFHGLLLHGLEDRSYTESILPTLKVYKLKHKHGLVERVS